MADTPRLKVKYQTEIVPALVEQLGIKNINCVPKLEKIVVNMGVGAAAGDSKLLDAAMNDMRIITGQQPCVTRAKKSIAGFHVREGQPIGCKVTLRGDRMWEFLRSVLAMALPRAFQWLPSRQAKGARWAMYWFLAASESVPRQTCWADCPRHNSRGYAKEAHWPFSIAHLGTKAGKATCFLHFQWRR